MSLDYDRKLKIKARILRKNETETELFLWKKLRCGQLNGTKFRRQFPIEGFILDFYCHAKKLAIELDGSQHKDIKNKEYDKYRSEVLNSLGIRVIRFWDNEVLTNIDGVLEEILRHLITSPCPSPEGEGK